MHCRAPTALSSQQEHPAPCPGRVPDQTPAPHRPLTARWKTELCCDKAAAPEQCHRPCTGAAPAPRGQQHGGPCWLPAAWKGSGKGWPCSPNTQAILVPEPALEQESGTSCAARQGHIQSQARSCACHGPLVWSPWQQLEWPGWLSLVPSHTHRGAGHAQCPPLPSRTHSEGSVAGCR